MLRKPCFSNNTRPSNSHSCFVPNDTCPPAALSTSTNRRYNDHATNGGNRQQSFTPCHTSRPKVKPPATGKLELKLPATGKLELKLPATGNISISSLSFLSRTDAVWETTAPRGALTIRRPSTFHQKVTKKGEKRARTSVLHASPSSLAMWQQPPPEGQ